MALGQGATFVPVGKKLRYTPFWLEFQMIVPGIWRSMVE
jgi:hypothetical protein